MTKTIVAAATLAVFASAASAADLGNGFTLNNEATAEYNLDTERFTADLEPTVGFLAPYGIQLEASTMISVYDDKLTITDTFDALPAIDFRAEKVVKGVTVYGEMSYDFEVEARSAAVIGAQFNF